MKRDLDLPLVVVVDDEPAVLRSIERLLRGERCRVVSTRDPAEALDWAQRRPVRLVLTDHRMPTMTGAELVAALAERAPGTASVLVTAYPDAPDLPESALRRVRRLISKPWNDDDLLRTVRDCLPPGTEEAEASLEARGLLRIGCRGRARGEILAELEKALKGAPDPGEGRTWVLLEDLPLAGDSVAKLLSCLVDLAERRSARLVVSDPSGLARAYLEETGGAGRFVAPAPRTTA